jgi:hypothetical protein
MGFKEDMRDLVKNFKLLEREYEQWFSGALITPPWATQKKCEHIVREYSRNPPQNMSEHSIFAMHQAKFATHMEMWNRRMRLKEEGRLPSGREERSKRVLKPSAPPGGGGDDPYRKVFDSYVAAKQNAGEATAKLNYDSFKNALKKQESQLRTKRGIQNVNFGVSVKDGKVSVVARKKKS